jgi:hypothetical protein
VREGRPDITDYLPGDRVITCRHHGPLVSYHAGTVLCVGETVVVVNLPGGAYPFPRHEVSRAETEL